MFLLASCNKDNNHSAREEIYTCPMHPTVIANKPGACPVCGMDLVRKARHGEEVKITEELSALIKSPNQTVVASVKAIKPEFKSVPLAVGAVGIVTYDTRNIYTLSARVAGRIEKMYLKYEFQKVQKGQKIAEIYSPELVSAQRELVYVLENDKENLFLIESSKKKLQLLGLSAEKISQLVDSKAIGNVITIRSPYSGYVITSEPGTPSFTSAAAGMDDMASPTSAATSQISSNTGESLASLIREGSYVSAGQTLIKIVNTDDLRIDLDVSGELVDVIKPGEKIKLDLGNKIQYQTIIDFVQPFFTAGEDFLKVRIYTDKTKEFRIGQLIEATINLYSPALLWIPKQAVVDLGNNKVIFIKDHDVFKPKIIVTGARAGEWIQVKSGLASSDEIASNAAYLVDSESFIKPLE